MRNFTITMYGGKCPGSIFIDTVHSMAEVICDSELLRNAVNELYKRLYDKDTKEIWVSFNEERCNFASSKNIEVDTERSYHITASEGDRFFDTITEYR